MFKNLSDQELMERIHSGDKAACSECIERHGDGVYRVALRLTRDQADAEDVVQETFLQAFRAIDSFEGRSEVSTWLYRIAYNIAMMRLRSARPELEIQEILDEESGAPVPTELFDWCCIPERDQQTREVQEEIERAINELPETLRAVFQLRELENLSTEECAQVLDISPDVVKQRLHRARLRLRDRLSGYFAERIKESQDSGRS